MRPEELLAPNCISRLKTFVDLLDQWRLITNLISGSGFKNVWQRHIMDSVRLQRVFPDKLRWVDFGTGAGFPGLVIGILLAGKEHAQVHCIESDSRKCAFLRMAVLELKIPVKIYNMRAGESCIETTGPAEVVTARAFSSIKEITRLSDAYLRAGAALIIPRGKTPPSKVDALDPARYTTVAHTNPESGGGYFLQIELRAGSNR